MTKSYATLKRQQETIEWLNRQGQDKREQAVAFLRELAGREEGRGHPAGAEWLRLTADLATHQQYPISLIWPWTVITHQDGHRYGRRFSTTIQARKWMGSIKAAQPDLKQWLVNSHTATPQPEGLYLLPGQLWCPYCAEARYFYHDSSTNYTKCYVCGVSTTSYYTQLYNFGGRMLERTDARVERRRERRGRRQRRREEYLE